MYIINLILFLFMVVALVGPFIVISVVLIFNSIVKRKIRQVEKNPSSENVKNITKIIKYGPVTKHRKKWEMMTNMFNKVSNSENVDYNSKEELYAQLVNKGCKISELKLKKHIH